MFAAMHFLRIGFGILFGALGVSPVHALQIRSYTAARHDRFTDYPSAPALNTSSWFDGSHYTGVGWSVVSPEKQFALVTRRHLVCAEHYRPSVNETIRFLSSSGVIVERTVTAVQNVTTSSNVATDISLCTLSAPIPATEGVTPFPYQVLANEMNFIGRPLIVFGWYGKVGKGQAVRFENSSSNVCLGFDYDTAATLTESNKDDCYFVGGDSGSPTFDNTTPAAPTLVGVHYGVDTSTTVYGSYDNFIPRYVSRMNLLLSPQGYRMIPSNVASVTLSSTTSNSPTTLRQGNAGSVTFILANTSAGTTGNLRYSLSFPAGQAPASITPSDSNWVLESSTATDYIFRRATLAGNSSASLVAAWTSLPLSSTLPVTITKESDGAAASSQTHTLALGDSFAAWANGLADTTQTGDPDEDGVSNLLEYAFGSSGTSGSSISPEGFPLLPEMTVTSGTATLAFPIRSDATARGLTYTVEYSETLESGSWTVAPPAGASAVETAYSPDRAGFLLRRISFPATLTRKFARVKAVLSE